MAGSANPQNTQAGPMFATMGPRPPANPYNYSTTPDFGPNGYQQAVQPLKDILPFANVYPQGPQPPAPPNVYQQSAQALTGAQNTANRLSNFTPTNMSAAGAWPTATYSGATVGQAPAYGGATVSPYSQMSAAQLGAANTMQGVGQVGDVFAPGQINVDQLRTMDISQYMNPYTQQVIDAGQADIERQRLMASNQLGAQAQAAGAFGGSRQAIQEGVLAGEAARQAAQLSAQQRQAGFGQALQSGQFDINQTQSARTLQSQQGMQANVLNQQAEEASAAREQAARAGNMQAANAFAVQQAQLEQQARAANQSAENARSAQQAGLTQQAGLAGSAQDAARFAQQAGLTQQAGLSNQGAINQAIESQAAREQQANATNYGGQFNAANIQAGAANQLGNLSQTGFGFGQQIGQQQAQQGLMQQGLQQALIDAARGQYAGAVGAPNASLGLPLTALGAMPNQSTTTQTKTPGLFDYLGLGASLLTSDTRLKTNITPRGTKGGIKLYSWDWNDEGKRIADPRSTNIWRNGSGASSNPPAPR